MEKYASSSSSSSKPFQFQEFNFSFNANENSSQAIDTQKPSLKGKEPMTPRTLRTSSKRTFDDSTPSWTSIGSNSVKPSESSDSSSNEGSSRKNGSSNGDIRHNNNQQAPSNERFLKLLKLLNPDVPLSAVTELNLSKQGIKKFDNMDTHLVSLKKLILSDNQLTHVANMPTSLTCLNLARNRITSIDLKQLMSLHKLDLSHNSVKDFSSLAELRCLRNVDASFNGIKSMGTFKNMNNLLWLSLKGNELKQIEFDERNSYCLKYLNMSFNKIKYLGGLEHLKNLNELFLDNNSILSGALDRPMDNLSKLILDHNRLTMFDASFFPKLTHLSLDNNSIKSIAGLKQIHQLDSFSLRNQDCEKTDIKIQHLRQSKKLYLSKCQFRMLNDFIDFYSLKYLELCSQGIEKLPPKIAQVMPNLSTLNVNYNDLRDLHPIRGLRHLEELSLVGNKIPYLPNLIDTLSHFRQLKHLDLRKNPITAVYYSSKVADIEVFDTKSPTQLIQDVEWGESDKQYIDTLDVSWRERRTIYRALVIKNCPSMVALDRIPVRSGESGQSHLIISDYISLFDPK